MTSCHARSRSPGSAIAPSRSAGHSSHRPHDACPGELSGSRFASVAPAGADTPVRFGIALVPATQTADRPRELARPADDAALDLVGIPEHPSPRRFLDTWSLTP